MSGVKHPAKFSPSILDVIRDQLAVRVAEDAIGLDPFAGVGRCHELGWWVAGNELEMPWCREHVGKGPVACGDATRLPYRSAVFDFAITSPTYGNRFADKHNARDGSTRRSYTHDLRAALDDPDYHLHPNNTGGMKWGADYWRMHGRAYDEVWRVLKDGGVFIVNVSDFVRRGEIVRVVDWHRRTLHARGFTVEQEVAVETPRMRYGANGDARAAEEKVLVCEKEPF